MLKTAWRQWKRFIVFLGNVQIVIVLTIVYWLLMPFIALPFKFLSDPLAARKNAKSAWKDENPAPHDMEFLKRQG